MKPKGKKLRSRLPSLAVTGAVLSLFTASHWAGQRLKNVGGEPESARAFLPHRIVGLSPSTTEVIHSLGLGQRVVGVSRYSTYPPEALGKPKVGGFLDIDFETLLELKADYVVMLKSQNRLRGKLRQLGLRTVSVDHASVEGIINSFRQIAASCGRKEAARQRMREIQTRLAAVRRMVAGRARPRVLVCIERDTDSTRPDQVVIAGNGGFHRELISIAGGVNAYRGGIAYPVLSREKLLELNPDVIIDLIRKKIMDRHGKNKLLAQWTPFQELDAVRNGRVVLITGDKHLLPGPRFPDTLEAMLKAIHPGLPENPPATE